MTTPTAHTPNLYTVHSNVIQGGQFSLSISYSTSGIDGKPHLQYQDTNQTLQFSGEEIRSLQSEIGTLVTVTIRRTVDSGFTSLTLVIPKIELGQSNQAAISTVGIATMQRLLSDSYIQSWSDADLYDISIRRRRRVCRILRLWCDAWPSLLSVFHS
jgi:hypothetical protein